MDSSLSIVNTPSESFVVSTLEGVMKFKTLISFIFVVCTCHLYAQSEYTETVPPSLLFRYDTGDHNTLLLAIGHKPVGKKDTFAGLYYEKDSITDSYSVSSLGIIAFNFSRQETANDGAELRFGLSKTKYLSQVREGIDIGLVAHNYLSENLAIGVGGVIRPRLLAYRSYQGYIAEYKAHIGVYYTATDKIKLSALYRYDGIFLEDAGDEYINDGFQVGLSVLF